MNRIARLAGAGGLLAAAFAVPAPSAAGDLSYGYRLLPVADDARPDAFDCGMPVEPLVDMSDLFAFYEPSRTQSEIDRDKMTEYVRRLDQAKRAVRLLSGATGAAVLGTVDRQSVRRCVVDMARSWAARGALLGNIGTNTPLGRRQANLEIAWTSIAFANALAVADLVEPLAVADRRIIGAWFANLSDELMSNFSVEDRAREDRWLNTKSNQWQWAAAAVAAMAVHLDDRRRLDWARGILDEGLDAAEPDGALPTELWRGKRALHYQNYALVAMSQVLHFATNNGMDLTPERNRALARIARFTLETYEDPSGLEAALETEMERSPGMLRWVAPVRTYFERSDRELAAFLAEREPPLSTWDESACTWVCLPVYARFSASPEDGTDEDGLP